ncbi:MAG: zinc-ribbon domain-containing protein [Bacilli bacterium]
MGKCRNCGSKIDENEKYCPVCGVINPIRVKKVQTVNDTSFLDPVEPDYQLYRQRSRKVTLLLFVLLGFTGAPFFYLGYKKRGMMWLLVHLLLLSGLPLLAHFQTATSFWQALLIVFLVLFPVNLSLGLYYRFARDVKDATGEFLRK